MYIGTPEEELPRAAQLMWPQQKQALDYLALGEASGWARGFGWVPNAVQNISGFAHAGLQAVGFDVDFGSIIDALAPRGISSFDFGGPESLRAAIPAANGLFTARSLARLYAALAGGGDFDDAHLFSRQTFYRATELQNEAPGRAVLPIDMRWRLGYHGIPTLRGFAPGAFGHFGFGGSGAWADPGRHLSFAMIVNSGMGTPLGDMRTARMTGIALDCAKRSRRASYSTSEQPAPLTAYSAFAQS
jgi:CubicO group peptidase (beta-lactamase class C family)